ncbi:MAG: translation initiation factor IF-2 N-terminal domain-containing protein, partial [Prevotellamassilia sp.]|nr:translation initiation factor IF-2 N-terminal domain-containing protein [Prevotellamassilia sp.]
MKIRLNKAIKEFGVGFSTVADFLKKKGHPIQDDDLNQKLDDEQYELLKEAFGADKDLKTKAEEMMQNRQKDKRPAAPKPAKPEPEMVETTIPEELRPRLAPKGKIDLDALNGKKEKPQEQPKEQPKAEEVKTEEVKTETQVPETPQAEAPAPETPAEETKAEAPAAEPAPQEQPQQEEKNAPKPKKQPLTVEERAAKIGTETDGIFRLNAPADIDGPKVLGTIDLSSINSTTRPKKKSKEELRKLRAKEKGTAANGAQGGQKKKRARISNERVDVNNPGNINGNSGGKKGGQSGQQNGQGGKKQKDNRKKVDIKAEVSEEDVAKQVKETLARLTNKQKGGKGAKYRKEKREMVQARQEEERREAKAESKIVKLTEFVTANELAQMMDVPVTKVISTCMSIGIMVSINQRMDAETIDLVAEEFGFKTEYVSADVQEAIAEEEDNPEDLEPRAPIVTVMGHVDHGKTSLLDHIRKSNVIAGEAGGITQHIGAYNVTLDNGRHITFLDTPGHEAFTAMRARGAQVTDIAIIIIAADDDIMPQTKEAISHAVAANVPIVFAINKVDKPHANPDKIKEGLAAMNFLVEEWGGKYQSQDISAKKGTGVNELL